MLKNRGFRQTLCSLGTFMKEDPMFKATPNSEMGQWEKDTSVDRSKGLYVKFEDLKNQLKGQLKGLEDIKNEFQDNCKSQIQDEPHSEIISFNVILELTSKLIK